MSVENQFSLLRKRRFAPFFLTQFFGAFNDNLFKQSLIIMIAFQAANLTPEESNVLVNLGAGLFILPFFLFSATAGELAEKYEKARLIRSIKLLEIAIMTLAAIGFYFKNVPLLLGLLFLMGTQSTLFAPVKYAILPQHLKDDELIGGNGLVGMGTFLAILLGTMAGGLFIGLTDVSTMAISTSVIIVALLGYAASRGIPLAISLNPEYRINWNPITETWRNLKFLPSNRTVYLSILGISWFWFLGATYLTQLPNYTKLTLGANEQVVTLLITLFSVGIGAGSLLCERLSGRMVELGLVPFGSIGLTLFGIDLYFAAPDRVAANLVGMAGFLEISGSWRIIIDIVLLGIFGGFYIVPLYALIQQRAEPSHRSRVIAGNSIVNALFMVLAALMAALLLKAGLTISQLFLITALLNALVAIYIYSLVPEFLMRFIVWMLIHTMYRVEKDGLDEIPERGAAVLVCNHVSFLDPLVIGGCCRRPVRFVMDHNIYRIPLLNFVFRTARAIPIASKRDDPVMLQRAYADINEALKSGDLICVFPEGAITRDGELQSFRHGVERIVEENPVPVIPMALRGLWGSFFSKKGGPAMLKWPRRLWSKIALVVGSPIAPEQIDIEMLYAEVLALRGDWK